MNLTPFFDELRLIADRRQDISNRLAIGVMGPLFGGPGALTRIGGGSTADVAFVNSSSMIVMDLVTTHFGIRQGNTKIAIKTTAPNMAELRFTPTSKAGDVTVSNKKFSDYLFKPGADHGKDKVFRAMGYSEKDSAQLAGVWKNQAAAQLAKGNYTLGKQDGYGQRIDIEIILPGKGSAAGQVSYIRSGWMLDPNGSIKLNTPFSGYTRTRK